HRMATDLQEPPANEQSEPAGIVLTLGAVARAFGVSVNTVRSDWRPSGMPGQKGAYDLEAIAEWRKLAQRRNSDQAAQTGMAELKQRLLADVRIREAEAQKRERLNKIAEGQMIDKDVVERRWAEHV